LGYDFTLEVSDIVIPEKCVYLETNLISDLENEDDLNFMTLDRLDTTKGFTKSNIIIISKMAHIMRNGSTPEILINFATNVLKIHNSEEE
jgi:archaellum biogenesis ATPase FlaH